MSRAADPVAFQVVPARVLIAPDKFAGSATAAQVADALAAGLARGRPGLALRRCPVADGGEGTVAAALAAGFERVPVTVRGPTGDPVPTAYARRGHVAVVELADACGRPQLAGGRPAPMTASSAGAGDVARAAIAAGAREVVLAVGGSASTDGGTGLLQALGVSVLDSDGSPVTPGGAGLVTVAALGRVPPDLAGVRFVLAADVDSPLTGPRGAAAVFGPQKGAGTAQVAALDDGLRHWADVVAAATGAEHRDQPGAGAAGGVGFAALAVLGATRRPGAEIVLELIGFEARLAGVDLVVTGEGRLDRSTLTGKAVARVGMVAERAGTPVVAVCGRDELSVAEARAAGLARVVALSRWQPDPARSMAEAEQLLEEAGAYLGREWDALILNGRAAARSGEQELGDGRHTDQHDDRSQRHR
ncbi:MAG: glycerate kinase [bacterium]